MQIIPQNSPHPARDLARLIRHLRSLELEEFRVNRNSRYGAFFTQARLQVERRLRALIEGNYARQR